MRKIPSLQWLISFEAVMRHRSMTHAAKELSLTQGAVSQHIQKLESFLDTPVFTRDGHQLTPSEEAVSYSYQVAELLEGLEEATLQLMECETLRGSLTVSVPTSFGSLWLMPRLGRFTEAYPDIQLHILNRDPNDRVATDRIDIAFQYAAQDTAKETLTPVFYEYLVPVCAPAYAARHIAIESPQELCQWRLLHLDERYDQSSQKWLSQVAGVERPEALPGLRFERQVFAILAACDGLGVAFVPEAYVEKELESGQLVKPIDCGVWAREALMASIPRYRVQNVRSQIFMEWLLRETELLRKRYADAGRKR